MWCHMCEIDFNTFEDFKDHIIKSHRDPASWYGKTTNEESDDLYPSIDIKVETDIEEETDLKSGTLIIEDEIVIKCENAILNAPGKSYDSDNNMAGENKSSNCTVSLNTMTEKSYSNQNKAGNILSEECHKDSPTKKFRQRFIKKKKLVSNSKDLNKFPKKYGPASILKTHKDKSPKSFDLKDLSKKRTPASYQKVICENSSANATELLLGQNSPNSESTSTNCTSMFSNKECYDLYHSMAKENKSPVVVLNTMPEEYLNNILNTSSIKLEQSNKIKEGSNSNLSNKLPGKSKTLPVSKKRVCKKKVNLEDISKQKKSASYEENTCEFTETNQTDDSKSSFNENAHSHLHSPLVQPTTKNVLSSSFTKLRPRTVKNKPVSTLKLPKKCGTILKKRVLKKQEKKSKGKIIVSFGTKYLHKHRKSASYRRDFHKFAGANRADQSSFNEDNNSQSHTSFVKSQCTSDNILNSSFKKLAHRIAKNKPATNSNLSNKKLKIRDIVSKKQMLKKSKKASSGLEYLPKCKKAVQSKSSFINYSHPSISSSCQSENVNSQPMNNNIPFIIYPQSHTSSNYQSQTINLQPVNNIPFIIYSQPRTSSNNQSGTVDLQPIYNNIPILGSSYAHQGLSNSVLDFITMHSAALKDLKEFDFSSEAILNWLKDFTKLCKNMQYPIPQSLYNTVRIVHTAIVDLCFPIFNKKEGEAVLKVYEALDCIIHKQINSTNNELSTLFNLQQFFSP